MQNRINKNNDTLSWYLYIDILGYFDTLMHIAHCMLYAFSSNYIHRSATRVFVIMSSLPCTALIYTKCLPGY